MKKGKLFVISGASGVGKSTVLGKVMAQRENLRFSVSATTSVSVDISIFSVSISSALTGIIVREENITAMLHTMQKILFIPRFISCPFHRNALTNQSIPVSHS